MEGVSPYIDDVSFGRFLSLLASTLAAGSQVAYDFKIQGVHDDFGREGRTQRPFRLPTTSGDVAAFHEAHGLQLEHLELSCELCARLLPGSRSRRSRRLPRMPWCGSALLQGPIRVHDGLPSFGPLRACTFGWLLRAGRPRGARASSREDKRFLQRCLVGIAERKIEIVGRAAGRREPVEKVPFPVGVPQHERDRRERLVAKREHALADRLAVRALADEDDRHERSQSVDHKLAGRR